MRTTTLYCHTSRTLTYSNKVFESEGADAESNRRSQSMDDGELIPQESAGRRAGDDAFVAPASNSYR